MKIFENLKDIKPAFGKGHFSYNLLEEKNGCVNGVTTGVSVYTATEYKEPGVHEDQEGFFVVEGSGYAKVGETEIRLEPGVSFIAQVGVAHSIKSDIEECPIKVFWFHSSI